MSMKLSAMPCFIKIPLILLIYSGKTDYNKKTLLKLDLEPKCQGHDRNQKTMTWGTKSMPLNKI